MFATNTVINFNRIVPLLLATMLLLLAGAVAADPQEDADQLQSMEQIRLRLQERLEQDPDCGEAVRQHLDEARQRAIGRRQRNEQYLVDDRQGG